MKRTAQIRVRVTKEMHDKIFEIAKKLGVTPSELTRQALVLYLHNLNMLDVEGQEHRKTESV